MPAAMASRATIPFLVAMMLLTGVTNTLLTKYQVRSDTSGWRFALANVFGQDNQCVWDCDNPDSLEQGYFKQPVLQTAQMFVGEMGCWLVVGLMKLYRHFADPQSPTENGYQPISTNADADGDAIGEGGVHPARRREFEQGAFDIIAGQWNQTPANNGGKATTFGAPTAPASLNLPTPRLTIPNRGPH